MVGPGAGDKLDTIYLINSITSTDLLTFVALIFNDDKYALLTLGIFVPRNILA